MQKAGDYDFVIVGVVAGGEVGALQAVGELRDGFADVVALATGAEEGYE